MVENSMNLCDLFEIIGERIKVTLREDLTPEQREIENEQSALVFEGAKQMVNVGDLILRTEKLQAQTKTLRNSVALKLVGKDKG